MNSNLSKRFRVLAMSLALIGMMPVGLMNNTAEASATGCTRGDGGKVCISVNGKGLNVKSVRATFQRDGGKEICDYSAKVVVKYPKGGGTELQKKGRSNCTLGAPFGIAYFDWNVNRDFPHGSKVYVYFYVRGKDVGGHPAITVKKKDSWPLW
jgi:hypothetical protein